MCDKTHLSQASTGEPEHAHSGKEIRHRPMKHAQTNRSRLTTKGNEKRMTALRMLDVDLREIQAATVHSPAVHRTTQSIPNPASSRSNFLQLVGLEKSYAGFPSLNGMDLNLPEGCIYGLLGPNGAGKSTTLKIIATLLRANKGTFTLGGINGCKYPERVRKLIGYVAQDCGLDKVLTGREHLIFQGDLHHLSDADIRRRSSTLIEMMNMGEWVDRRTGCYSGGMRRRLELACSLIHEPQLLVLDEPTVGLDHESRRVIWEILLKLKRDGKSVLISSHDLKEIEVLADRVGIIEGGRLIAEGNPMDLKASLGGDRLSLRLKEFSSAEEANRARTSLGSCKGVRQLVIDPETGHTLHMIIDDPTVIEDIRARLNQSGLPIFSLTHSKTSLEDLYLQATGRSLADADRTSHANRNFKAEHRQSMR
jgi:ABC-2 type transport system ATP-binding protein